MYSEKVYVEINAPNILKLIEACRVMKEALDFYDKYDARIFGDAVGVALARVQEICKGGLE